MYNSRMKKNQHHSSSKKRLVIGLLIFVIVACSLFFGWVIMSRSNHKDGPQDTIKFKPATKEEKQAADDNKAVIVSHESRQNTQATTPGQKKAAAPIIVVADRNGVRGYVNGVFEENGSCIFTATKNGETLKKTSIGFQNVSYTQCPPIIWDTPLPTGSWSIGLTYTSQTATGSVSKIVQVQ